MAARVGLGRKTTAAATAAVLVAGIGVAVSPASAQPLTRLAAQPVAPDAAGTATPAPLARHRAVDPAKFSPGLLDRSPNSRLTVFVRLTGSGAAAVSARTLRTTAGSPTARSDAARSAALSRRSQIQSLVSNVLNVVTALDAKAAPLFRVTNALPGFAINATTSALRELAARPDVAKISVIVPKKPTNSSAAQLTKVLSTWQSLGLTGDGITVGVVDTGLDYTHADFGGTGTVAAYNAAKAASTDPNWYSALPVLAQAKIAGGRDFVGDAYSAEDPKHSTPVPDANPIDCGDHGTHVAGTIAGYGVTAGGATFGGSYATLTGATLNAMKVGPGMAPKAKIYPMKVFGCTGSTDIVIPALDAALDPNGDGNFTDHLDVVNLSLGSDYSPVDDPQNDVVDAIAAAGVLPVISMGNNGDLTDTGGSPGNAVRALAVASSVDAVQLRDGLRVNAPTAGIVPGQNSGDYPWATRAPVTGTVVKVTDPANADGCDPIADNLTGKVVWLEWDDNDGTRRCGSAARSANAKAAHALGVILTSTRNVFGAGIAGDPDIPVFQLPKTGTDALRPALTAGTLNVTFDGTLAATIRDTDAGIADRVSSFTSRGTHGSLGVVKPDVTAPGDTIASAGMGTGNGVLVMSGTSMAAPLTAGVAALVRAKHPAWTVEQAKAAIMNTAGNDLFDGPNKTGHRYGPARVGAGRIDAQAAVQTDVLAYETNHPGGVSASFGVVEAPIGSASVVRTRTIRVQNTGPASAALTLSYNAIVAQPGVTYTVSPATLTLAPGASATATVRMTIKPTALRHTIDPTMQRNQDFGFGPLGRQFVSDASGRVLIARSGRPTLRVPVYGAAKPVSNVTAGSVTLGTTAGLRLNGRGIDQGTGPSAYASAVSVMDFGAESRRLPVCPDGAPIDGCTPNQSAKGGDIRYVGAGSARLNGSLADGFLWFGIATYANSATLGNSVIPYVDFDTTGDGVPDYETYLQNAAGTDVLMANTVDMPGGNVVDLEPVNFNWGDVDTNAFDTNVMLLPVWPAAIGLSDTDTSFPITYRAGMYSVYGSPANSGDIDSVGPVTFDVVNPAVRVGAPLWIDASGASIGARTTAVTPALVLHLHNSTASRAQKVMLRAPSRLAASRPATIAYGANVKVTTRLTNQLSGAGLPNRTVTLYARSAAGHSWTKVRDLLTAGDGSVATLVSPKRQVQYQWRFGGDTTHAPVTSGASTVVVKQVVSAAAPGRIAPGTQFTVWGRINPTQTGVTVYLQQWVNGTWQGVATTTVATQPMPNGQTLSGYRFARTGNTAARFRTLVNARSGLAPGVSPTLTVIV